MRHEPARGVLPLFAVRRHVENAPMFQDDDMNSPATGPAKESAAPQQEGRLDSWKAIASYLKRDVTTVQRWEKREGMPIRRHLHDKRGSVYAFRGELDTWMAARGAQLAPERRPLIRPRYLAGALGVLVLAGFLAWWLTHVTRDPAQPLRDARVVPLTDFEGVERAAAISRDGRFVAFLSDRDGKMDAWVTQVGSGEFRNLTQGQAPELLNPEVRSLGFTPDGSLVTLWTRVANPKPGTAAVNMWAVPVIGGPLRPFRNDAVEMDWASDGGRSIFHTTDPGDPTFLVTPGEREPRRVHAGTRGVHCHFQTWSPDDSFIYFTQGIPPDEMDLWRMKPDGTAVERLTSHKSRVLYPAFVDQHTLWYLANIDEGAGPWLYSYDIQRRQSQRVSFGIEQYTSLAASGDGRRLVATVERAKASLWRIAMQEGIAAESAARRIELSSVGGLAPRTGTNYLLYVSPKGAGYGIWKLASGTATELLDGSDSRIVGGVAISPDGTQVAFTEESRGGTRLNVMQADGGAVRSLSGELEIRGAPAWAPDGASLTVAAVSERGRRLFRIPVDGSTPKMMFDRDAINPQWSSDGRLLAYAEIGVGPTYEVKVANADGTPREFAPITLPRGSRRITFVPGKHALVVLQGEMTHVNFWYVDLDSGQQRQLTDFGREFAIGDFDVTANGEIVFDRRYENSDIALIEWPGR
jgi:Tol biopolymer transport system component